MKRRCAGPGCNAKFAAKRAGHDFCSRKCQLAARNTSAPVRATHLVIPDTQCKPGVPNDHLRWLNRYALDKYSDKPLTVVHLGDHWDMPSLSTYDKGKGKMEGRRYQADIEAGNQAFEILTDGWDTQPQWDKHFLFGNHEERILRAVNDNPQLDGLLSLDSCITPPDWQRHPFLEVVKLHGVNYSHYFYHPRTGRPYGGDNVELRLKTVGASFVMGHQQGLLQGMRYSLGKQLVGLVAGSFYQHDEDYLGPQANTHWRGFVVLHNVHDGEFDTMSVPLDYLCIRYEGHGIDEHRGLEL